MEVMQNQLKSYQYYQMKTDKRTDMYPDVNFIKGG